MLLRHTTNEIKERKALTVNPAKTCQPVGAMYAALGIHGCLPHSHGSQGCCAYHRSALTRHYKEPVMAATSSFTEGSSVFGGQANLVQAINNIFTVYDPEVIAIHTTCLSETIGDDLTQMTKKAHDDGKVPEGKKIIYCNTPSYVGSHVTGFSNMVKGMVDGLAEISEDKLRTVNIIPGWVEPSDMREIKRLCKAMEIKTIMFPDTSDVLDTPMTGKHEFYPKGGATIEDIAMSGSSQATVALGPTCSAAGAKALDVKCKVRPSIIELPIGLTATDTFIDTLRKVAGVAVPDEITRERGRLVDVITDMHQYFYGKRVALYGDPDQLVSLAQFVVDLDMIPACIITGSPGEKALRRRLEAALGEKYVAENVYIGQQADMYLLHQLIKNNPVDLMIGNCYGKYIERDEGIPLLRHGFPIYDRVGHSYFPSVGYTGALRLVEKMLDIFLSKKDVEAPEEKFELVM